jgi:hypothetical protein
MSATKEEYFKYLDGLRQGAVTNMYGAAPYIQREFGVSYDEAESILREWMKTFSDRHGGE